MAREVSDEAVTSKTGKSWREWFTLLDRWGAARKSHKEIAAHLVDRHHVRGWWAQTITVHYERDRMGRQIGQKGTSFDVSIRRTIGCPVSRVWEAFTVPADLNRWFSTGMRVKFEVGGRYSNRDGDRGQFLRIEHHEMIRLSWDNPEHCPGSQVDVNFSAVTPRRATIYLTHSRLPSAAGREEMKEGWSWALDNLKGYIETGTTVTFEEWQAARG